MKSLYDALTLVIGRLKTVVDRVRPVEEMARTFSQGTLTALTHDWLGGLSLSPH